MNLSIHFFRKNSLGKIDYTKILEYFETLPNFKIFYTDDNVEMVYGDHEFEFEYRFLITKQSKVQRIYELNPMYSNINFMVEIPLLIPSFLAKEVLALVQKICKLFDLEIYQLEYKDVEPFNLVDVLVLFEKNRRDYLENHEVNDTILYDSEKLNIICKYQRSIASLQEYYNHTVDVGYCIPVVDDEKDISGISYTWNFGKPAIFPPYIDYIMVKDLEETLLLKREDLYRILAKYFIEIKTVLPDLYIMKEKQAKKARKEFKLLKKSHLSDLEFRTLRLCDVIEK
ncbi:MAG: hypothetical protein PHY42_02680 [Bacilli bacterium]|nr:hypothetical protein [Bacilli bacterium]